MKYVLVNLLYILLAADILPNPPEASSPPITSPTSQEKQISQHLFWTKAGATILELEEYQIPS